MLPGKRTMLCAVLACFAWPLYGAQLQTSALKVEVVSSAGAQQLVTYVRAGGRWLPALSAKYPVLLRTASESISCNITGAKESTTEIHLLGSCAGVADFEQTWSLTPVADIVDVGTRVHLRAKTEIFSAEDRYSFLPPKNLHIDEHTGPLDFVWSQNIKREQDDLIPANAFKSPALMLQL